ncbi:MAG: STAS domain-containing protein [Anaerolineales bacterium]
MTIRVYQLTDEVWAVAPEGRVDTAVAGAVEAAFNGLFDEGHTRVVADLSGVTYMASSGLRALLLSWRRAGTLGGGVELAGVNDRVQDVLSMAGLDQVFRFHATAQEAVERFAH